jgi:thiol-disulfide isomerase/thioredoxin
MKSNQITIALIFILFIAIILYLTPIGNEIKETFFPVQKSVNQEEFSLTNQDFDLSLRGITSSDKNLSQLKGKVIFMNFWGTWCPPCRAEMPSIQALYNKYGKEVEFVAIALPKRGEEIKDEVIQFLTQNNYMFPTYELQSMPSQKFESDVIPNTIIIDKKGNIAYKYEGAKDWNDKDTNLMIQKLIKE